MRWTLPGPPPEPIRMTDADNPASTRQPLATSKSRRTRLRRILDERPEARSRLARAIAALLGTTLVAIVAIGALLLWHVQRRGRLIRERLASPRDARLPDLSAHGDKQPS
jgi:hypothetical protein